MDEKECVKQGPEGRVWKFVEEEDIVYQSTIFNRECNFNWLKITPDGKITVKGSFKKGYAWDGCTPKFNVFHITWGNFDGQLIKHHVYKKYRPYTYYASMVHDVLYQYKRCVPLTRREVDKIFLEMLRDSGFMFSGLYWLGVRIFGGFFGKWPYRVPSEPEYPVTEKRSKKKHV